MQLLKWRTGGEGEAEHEAPRLVLVPTRETGRKVRRLAKGFLGGLLVSHFVY